MISRHEKEASRLVRAFMTLVWGASGWRRAAEKLPADYRAEKIRREVEWIQNPRLIYDRHESGVMFQINTLDWGPAMGSKGTQI